MVTAVVLVRTESERVGEAAQAMLGVEGVTESLLKRYGLPMILVSPHLTAAVLVAYVGQGRFAVPKNAPVLDLAARTLLLVTNGVFSALAAH